MLSFLWVCKLLEGRDHIVVSFENLQQYHRALHTVRTHKCLTNLNRKLEQARSHTSSSAQDNSNLGVKLKTSFCLQVDYYYYFYSINFIHWYSKLYIFIKKAIPLSTNHIMVSFQPWLRYPQSQFTTPILLLLTPSSDWKGKSSLLDPQLICIYYSAL